MFVPYKEKNNFIEEYVPIIIFGFTIVFFILSLFMSLSIEVQAAETSEESDYTQTDFEQDERLNSLELRLEELGYSINEVEQAIVLLQETVFSLSFIIDSSLVSIAVVTVVRYSSVNNAAESSFSKCSIE